MSLFYNQGGGSKGRITLTPEKKFYNTGLWSQEEENGPDPKNVFAKKNSHKKWILKENDKLA